MRQAITRLGWVAVLAAAALPALSADQEIALTHKLTAGSAQRFHSVEAVKVMGTDVQVTRTFKRTVKEVKPTGEAVIEEVAEAGKVAVNGQEMDLPAGGSATVTTDRMGKVVQFKAPEGGLTTPAVAELLVDTAAPVYPEKPVPPGAAWTTEYPNPVVQGQTVQVKTTLTGTEKLDARDTVKLVQTAAPEVEAGKKLQVESTYWLEPATGTVAKYVTRLQGLPTQYGVLDITSTVTAEPADK